MDDLVDCSEVIPVPKHWDGPAVLLPTKTLEDLDHPVSDGIEDLMFRRSNVLTISFLLQCPEQPFPILFTTSKS